MSSHDISSPSTAFRDQQGRNGVPDCRWTIACSELVSSLSTGLAVWISLLQEGLQMKALESRTLVAGIKESDIRESVIDGTTRILVDRDDDKIAAATLELQQHQEKRARMSRQALEHVRLHWTWKRVGGPYVEEVRKVVNIRVLQTPAA